MKETLAIEILNKEGDESYGFVYPDAPRYSSYINGGFGTLTFNTVRFPFVEMDDIKLSNMVRAYYGDALVYEGELTEVTWQISAGALVLTASASGFCNRLKTAYPLADIGNEKGSAYIARTLLADDDLSIRGGDIESDDYLFPSGFDLSSHTYFDALEEINRYNGWLWGIWDNRALDWKPKPAVPDYYIDAANADMNISYSLDGIVNYITYRYSGGSATVEDAVSQSNYRKRAYILDQSSDGVQAQTATAAAIYLSEHKGLKPRTEVTAAVVRDASGRKVPIYEVRAGKTVSLENISPIDISVADAAALNETNTFTITSAEVDIAAGLVRLSPAALGLRFDKYMAKVELAKQKVL